MSVRSQFFGFGLSVNCVCAAIFVVLFGVGLAKAQMAPPAAFPAGQGAVNNLMPAPATVVTKPGTLRIDSGFSYGLHGDTGARLSEGAARFVLRLEMRTGIALVNVASVSGQQATLDVEVATASTEAVPQPEMDESY